MIDIHTHILPGIDDGAASWQDTLNMAKAAVHEGITTIIATPHHLNGRYDNKAMDVIEHTQRLNMRLKEEGIPLTLEAGQEIRVHDDLLDAWNRKELLSLAGSKYVLIELPSARIPKTTHELLHELNVLNLTPIIAHPERNAEIMQHPERLAELIERGACAQVTTHSLLGGFGRSIEKAAWSLCRSGLIHIVASDAHHVDRRSFRLGEAYQAIHTRMGAEWESYFKSNALAIIEHDSFRIQPAAPTGSAGAWHRIITYFHRNK